MFNGPSLTLIHFHSSPNTTARAERSRLTAEPRLQQMVEVLAEKNPSDENLNAFHVTGVANERDEHRTNPRCDLLRSSRHILVLRHTSSFHLHRGEKSILANCHVDVSRLGTNLNREIQGREWISPFCSILSLKGKRRFASSQLNSSGGIVSMVALQANMYGHVNSFSRRKKEIRASLTKTKVTSGTRHLQHQWSIGRVSALKLVGGGFDPRPGRTQDCKNGAHCLPVWHSVSGVGIGWFDHPMIPGRSTAAAQRCLRGMMGRMRRTNHSDFNFKI